MKERRNGKTKWQKTSIPNLMRNRDSGRYYFRASITKNGKRREVWKSLKTSTLTVAKLRLIDEQATIEHQRQAEVALEGKSVTVGQLSKIYEEQVKADPDLKPASKDARLFALERLFRTWPGLNTLPAADVTAKECQRWLTAFKGDAGGLGESKGKPPGATSVNTAVDCLRRLMALAEKNGFIYRNPATGLSYKKTPRKHLRLPSGNQFRALVAEIEKNPRSAGAADTVAVLGFSGMRLGEGMALRWRDVDFERGILHVTGTKTDESFRTIPLFPPLREILAKLRQRNPKADRVLTVRDCGKSLDKATEALGLPRMTHHDLRHFFVSSCIEAGIDFLTISRWVGHADGGVLISRVYGHLRREYSMAAAMRVTFGEEPEGENVVKMEAVSG